MNSVQVSASNITCGTSGDEWGRACTMRSYEKDVRAHVILIHEFAPVFKTMYGLISPTSFGNVARIVHN